MSGGAPGDGDEVPIPNPLQLHVCGGRECVNPLECRVVLRHRKGMNNGKFPTGFKERYDRCAECGISTNWSAVGPNPYTLRCVWCRRILHKDCQPQHQRRVEGPLCKICYHGEAEWPCEVCGQGGDALLCDTCDTAHHLHCVGLESIPEDYWQCDACQARGPWSSWEVRRWQFKLQHNQQRLKKSHPPNKEKLNLTRGVAKKIPKPSGITEPDAPWKLERTNQLPPWVYSCQRDGSPCIRIQVSVNLICKGKATSLDFTVQSCRNPSNAQAEKIKRTAKAWHSEYLRGRLHPALLTLLKCKYFHQAEDIKVGFASTHADESFSSAGGVEEMEENAHLPQSARSSLPSSAPSARRTLRTASIRRSLPKKQKGDRDLGPAKGLARDQQSATHPTVLKPLKSKFGTLSSAVVPALVKDWGPRWRFVRSAQLPPWVSSFKSSTGEKTPRLRVSIPSLALLVDSQPCRIENQIVQTVSAPTQVQFKRIVAVTRAWRQDYSQGKLHPDLLKYIKETFFGEGCDVTIEVDIARMSVCEHDCGSSRADGSGASLAADVVGLDSETDTGPEPSSNSDRDEVMPCKRDAPFPLDDAGQEKHFRTEQPPMEQGATSAPGTQAQDWKSRVPELEYLMSGPEFTGDISQVAALLSGVASHFWMTIADYDADATSLVGDVNRFLSEANRVLDMMRWEGTGSDATTICSAFYQTRESICAEVSFMLKAAYNICSTPPCSVRLPLGSRTEMETKVIGAATSASHRLLASVCSPGALPESHFSDIVIATELIVRGLAQNVICPIPAIRDSTTVADLVLLAAVRGSELGGGQRIVVLLTPSRKSSAIGTQLLSIMRGRSDIWLILPQSGIDCSRIAHPSVTLLADGDGSMGFAAEAKKVMMHEVLLIPIMVLIVLCADTDARVRAEIMSEYHSLNDPFDRILIVEEDTASNSRQSLLKIPF